MMEPKIRFKGFEGEWKTSTIGDFTTSFSGGTPTAGASEFYGGNIPFIRSGEIHESKTELFLTEAGLNNSSAKVVEKGTLLYALYGATSGEVGISKIRGAINQAILAIYPNKTVDKRFLANYLQSHKQKIVGELLQGGQGNLSGALVKSISVTYPNNREQQTISDYVDSLDSQISAATSRLASLKQMKAASLQAMFPQEGETVPKIRFKGFEGEWKKVKLGDIAKFTKGQGYSKSDLKETGQPIILYGRMYTKYQFVIGEVDTFANLKDASILSEGDEIIMPASGETPEDIACASAVLVKDIILGGDLNIMHFDLTKISTPYIALVITYSKTHHDLSKCAQGKSVVHLHNGAISRATISLPSLAEQQAIASYFTSLDRQISLQSQRLEKLKQIKSACLDKMFV